VARARSAVMEPIAEDGEGAAAGTSPPVSPLRAARSGGGATAPLQTLTSGRRREVRGGAFQAHICVVSSEADVAQVMAAFQQAEGFRNVVSWSYAYRIKPPQAESPPILADAEGAFPPMAASQSQALNEGAEDGLDDGCGSKILSVLRRFTLQGLLLVISRWQEYGATPGLELFGTELYALVVERCKDLIAHLKEAMGISDPEANATSSTSGLRAALNPGASPAPKKLNIDFSFLPALPEPRAPSKYGPNHFLADTPMNRQASLPHLFSGGDVRLWMANDQCLRNLPDSELWAMRSLRQPDVRMERVLQAVAILRGQKVPLMATASNPTAKWGYCKEVLRSPTLRTELLLFDASHVPSESAKSALNLVEGLDPEELRRVSAGAAALLEWVQGVVRWRLEGPPSPISGEPSKSVSLHQLRPRQDSMQSASPKVLRKSLSGPKLRKSCLDLVAKKRFGVPLSLCETR